MPWSIVILIESPRRERMVQALLIRTPIEYADITGNGGEQTSYQRYQKL
jgi:hypothetical protein